MEAPRFTTRRRPDGKISLWVNGWNIWDLEPKECTEAVKVALMYAYFLGMKHMKGEIMESCQVEPIWEARTEFVAEDSR